MQFELTIAGVAKQLKAGTFRLTETANRRCTAVFQLDSLDRSYRPAEGAEVIIEEDGARIFAGLVDRPSERGFGGPLHPGISTTVNVVDFTVYAERRFVNLTLAAGTLKSQLSTLVTTYLATYGVTLDASQVDGPTMPELVYDYKRLDAVLHELMTLTADAGQPYIWEISYSKVLSAYQPSTEAAPFNLSGDDLPEVVGDIQVETSRSDHYANRIILKVQPKTELARVESFTGDGSSDSVTLQYTPFEHRGYVTYDGIFETLTTTPFAGSASWTLDMPTGVLTREAGPIGNGLVVSINFDGTFAGEWIAEDAGEIASVGVWERVLVLESIPNDSTGQAFADAELAKRIAAIKTVQYVTWQQGLAIGQQQTIAVPSRNVSGDAVVVHMVTRDLVHRLERSVTAVIDSTQTNLGRSFQDDYAIWYGDKTGAAAPAPTVGASAGAISAAPPFRSVQFNRDGAFGGDADFLYYEDENSIVCGGGGSSITAANFESCQVFGYNNHISDP